MASPVTPELLTALVDLFRVEHAGEQRAIKAADLAHQLGVDGRTLRSAIAQLRRDRHLIVGGNSGLWRATCWRDVQRYNARQLRRARRELISYRPMLDAAYDEFSGQMQVADIRESERLAGAVAVLEPEVADA